MDVFDVREQLVADYRSFTAGTVDVRDERLRELVDRQLDEGVQWPEPWLSLNPSFASGGTIDELVSVGALHPECATVFRSKTGPEDRGRQTLTLHQHQRDALAAAATGGSYVLTTGTGSGKSLGYIVPIVDAVLREPRRRGVKAIIVYPMNALANSQLEELKKFLQYGFPTGGEPVTFARYTGQESQEERDRLLRDPPDIVLTNYVMLDLVLTRPAERERLVRAAQGLRFLVLDELHTYRGRQGADVAMLVRRVRDACAAPALQCIGTSATMASGGTAQERRCVVAEVASRLFGAEVPPERVIGETLTRATTGTAPTAKELTAAVRRPASGEEYEVVAAKPLALWVEGHVGLTTEAEGGPLVRALPRRLQDAAVLLAEESGEPVDSCATALRDTLLAGAAARHPRTGRSLFAFRLHQFLSKGDAIYASLESEASRHITGQYQTTVPGAPARPLFPLALCRECGQEYYVVARTQKDGQTTYAPRRERDASGGNDVGGYLFVSGDDPWPADPVLEGRLPDDWLETDSGGEVDIVPRRRRLLPTRVHVCSTSCAGCWPSTSTCSSATASNGCATSAVSS